MKGLGRNLIYWGMTMQKMVLAMFVGTAMGVSLMAFMDGGNFLEEVADALPEYLLLIAVICIFVNAMGGFNGQYALTISFGSSRKNSYIAMQIVQHLVALEIMAAVALCLVWIAENPIKELLWNYPLTCVGAAFLLVGISNLLWIMRGWLGIVAGTGCAVLMMLLVMGSAIFVLIVVMMDIPVSHTVSTFLSGPWVLLLGMVLDLALVWVTFFVIKKTDLKFA